MHEDVQKIINIAKETGELTDKQKEIILRKAEKLGEDIDEVEMFLESLKLKPIENNALSTQEKRVKCPNCGAIISETSLKCPDCGYIFQQENKASSDARIIIEKLKSDLKEAERSRKKVEDIVQIQASIVNTFTLPTTKQGLLLFLDFSFSNYCSIGNSSNYKRQPLKDAWYGKTVMAYNSLTRIGGKDPDIEAALRKYSSLISTEEKKNISRKTQLLIVAAILVFIYALVFVQEIRNDKRDMLEQSRKEQFEECLKNHDFQGAKSMVQGKYYGTEREKRLDDISVQEVLYLVSIGNIQQAKIVSSSIASQEKRNNVLSEIEKQERSDY